MELETQNAAAPRISADPEHAMSGKILSVTLRFESFRFEPRFAVDVDPEFPGDGQWRHPVYGFGRNGSVVEHFDSSWGTPVILEVVPVGSSSWIGMYAAGGLGGVRTVCACPNELAVCVAVDGLAYVTEVLEPTATTIVHDCVTQVAPVEGLPLLLLVSFTDIVALASDGIAWRTPRLVLDGLRVLDATPERIVCAGDNLGGTPTLEVDPATGGQTSGTRLDPKLL